MASLSFVAKAVKACNENKGKMITIRHLSRIAGMSYNATYRTVQSLKEEGVVNLIKVGSASVVQLEESEKTRGFIALAESYLPNHGKKK